MYILRIEHGVTSYDAWKRAFDSDPIGRRRAGVRRHRIMRTCGDEDDVTIDLEFGSLESAGRGARGARGAGMEIAAGDGGDERQPQRPHLRGRRGPGVLTRRLTRLCGRR